MNKPLQKLRRFFTRTKKFNATANPDALSAAYDDDDGASRLSGAFIVVLVLHIVALAGVFAFARIKDSRAAVQPNPPASTNTAPVAAVPSKNPSAKQPGAPAPSVPQPAVAGPGVNAAPIVHHESKPAVPEPS